MENHDELKNFIPPTNAYSTATCIQEIIVPFDNKHGYYNIKIMKDANDDEAANFRFELADSYFPNEPDLQKFAEKEKISFSELKNYLDTKDLLEFLRRDQLNFQEDERLSEQEIANNANSEYYINLIEEEVKRLFPDSAYKGTSAIRYYLTEELIKQSPSENQKYTPVTKLGFGLQYIIHDKFSIPDGSAVDQLLFCSKRLHQFITGVISSDDLETYQVATGLMLYKQTTPAMFWFHGTGSNGKSMLGKFNQKWLGKENYIPASPHEVENGRYITADLKNKTAIIKTEMDYTTPLSKTAIHKALTGDDEAYNRQIFAKASSDLLFATPLYFGNMFPPILNETDFAFWDRQYFIHCPFTHERNDNVKASIETELYNSEIFVAMTRWALAGLLKYLNSGKVPKKLEWEEAERHYRTLSDPVFMFLKDMISITESGDDFVTFDALLDTYNRYARIRHLTTLNSGKFKEMLRQNLKGNYKVKKASSGKKRPYGLVGIKINRMKSKY